MSDNTYWFMLVVIECVLVYFVGWMHGKGFFDGEEF